MNMRSKQWTALLLALALALTLGLAACGDDESGTALRVCLGGAQETLDPAFTETDDNATILYHLYENLLRQESEGAGEVTLVSGVADSYEETDNFDGTVSYVFTLSPEAKWSDGTAVTAEDFVYSWQRLADPATGSPNRELLAMIEGFDEVTESGDPTQLAVSATEDGRLKVTTAYHCPYFLTAVCAGAATMPVRGEVLGKVGAVWGTTPAGLVTNGAYVLEEWEKEDHLTLVRNAARSDELGPDSLTFRFAVDQEAALALYSGGEVDFVSWLPDEEILRLKQTDGWMSTPMGMTEVILFNRSAAFGGKPMRKAFTLAADMEGFSELLQPADQLATGLVPFGIRESDGDDFRTVGGTVFDLTATEKETRLEEAKTALQEARDALEEGKSLPGEVEFIYLAGERRNSTAELLRDGWQETLGIRVQLTPLTEAELEQRLAADDYDLAWITVRASYADGTAFLETGSNGLEEAIAADTVEYSRLMSVLRGALDPLARDNYLHAAEELTFEEYSVLPLVFRGTTQEKTDAVLGVGYDGLGRYLFHRVSLEKQG